MREHPRHNQSPWRKVETIRAGQRAEEEQVRRMAAAALTGYGIGTGTAGAFSALVFAEGSPVVGAIGAVAAVGGAYFTYKWAREALEQSYQNGQRDKQERMTVLSHGRE